MVNAARPCAVTGQNAEENTSFHCDAKRRELVHSSNPVEEPRRPNQLVGPTAYKENEKEERKFNFSDSTADILLSWLKSTLKEKVKHQNASVHQG